MKKSKLIILIFIVGIIGLGYYFLNPEEQQGPEVKISANTKMESSLSDNALTKQYSTDNLLTITLTPKKDYVNLSLNVTSKGLDFSPLQPTNNFDLTKNRVFKFKITIKPDYKVGSNVDYWVSVIDNSKPYSNTTKTYEYEVGKVSFFDIIISDFWGLVLIIVLLLVSVLYIGRKKSGQLFESLIELFIKRF